MDIAGRPGIAFHVVNHPTKPDHVLVYALYRRDRKICSRSLTCAGDPETIAGIKDILAEGIRAE